MELMTETRPGGTKLRIDADRSLDQPSGDSVLRVFGERDGASVLDVSYVEVDEHEAYAVGKVLTEIQQPTPEVLDKIAQEVQATFGSQLGGRDAHQIAQICTRAWWESFSTEIGPREITEKLPALAERFQRASASKRQSPSSSYGNGEQRGKG